MFLLHQPPPHAPIDFFILKNTGFLLLWANPRPFPFFTFSWPPFSLRPFLPFPSPFPLPRIPYIPPSSPPISWFPQLLVRGRLRWLTEAEMDEVSAQRRPNGILAEQHQRPTSRRRVTSDQVWWQLYTVVPLLLEVQSTAPVVRGGSYRLNITNETQRCMFRKKKELCTWDVSFDIELN